jgi:hypothetical protein
MGKESNDRLILNPIKIAILGVAIIVTLYFINLYNIGPEIKYIILAAAAGLTAYLIKLGR